MSAEALAPPSPWLLEHARRLEEAVGAGLGPVADVACGRGRHALACAERGWPVLGLDRDLERLRFLSDASANVPGAVSPIACDLGNGSEIPIRSGSCGAILVFRFLFRPLAPALADRLAPGGWLLYETFTRAQADRDYGPSRPEFLLQPDELPALFPELEIVAHEEGLWGEPRPLALARLLARRPT